jgi:hypothetical protein
VDEAPVALPNAEGSLKFVVLGDFGTGGRSQYDLAATMARFHDKFKFDTVITVGDNLYGSQRPKDYATKFEIPYKPLLDAGVKFYASHGNHDSREQQNYLFNMGGSSTTFSLPASRCLASCSIPTTRRPSNSPGSRGAKASGSTGRSQRSITLCTPSGSTTDRPELRRTPRNSSFKTT